MRSSHSMHNWNCKVKLFSESDRGPCQVEIKPKGGSIHMHNGSFIQFTGRKATTFGCANRKRPNQNATVYAHAHQQARALARSLSIVLVCVYMVCLHCHANADADWALHYSFGRTAAKEFSHSFARPSGHLISLLKMTKKGHRKNHTLRKCQWSTSAGVRSGIGCMWVSHRTSGSEWPNKNK